MMLDSSFVGYMLKAIDFPENVTSVAFVIQFPFLRELFQSFGVTCPSLVTTR